MYDIGDNVRTPVDPVSYGRLRGKIIIIFVIDNDYFSSIVGITNVQGPSGGRGPDGDRGQRGDRGQAGYLVRYSFILRNRIDM